MVSDEVIRYVVESLERLGVPYVVTGSYAIIAYGVPRMTNDIDIVVRLTLDDVPAFERVFPEPIFYLSIEAARQAIRDEAMFNVIHVETAMKIDFYPRRHGVDARAQFVRVNRLPREGGYSMNVISPEEVIVQKMLFHREGRSERQIQDILGVLDRRGDILDFEYLEQRVAACGLHDIWKDILDRRPAIRDRRSEP